MTPEQKRKWAIGFAIVVAIVTVGSVVSILFHGSAGTAKPGCINVQITGVTGGITLAACGAQASSVCAKAAKSDDIEAPHVLADCRKQNIQF